MVAHGAEPAAAKKSVQRERNRRARIISPGAGASAIRLRQQHEDPVNISTMLAGFFGFTGANGSRR